MKQIGLGHVVGVIVVLSFGCSSSEGKSTIGLPGIDGGVPAGSGGKTATGGRSGTLDAMEAGGSAGSASVPSTGGMTGTGGVSSAVDAGVPVSTGGRVATDAAISSDGAARTGGRVGTGGAVLTGGRVATGGAIGSGGAVRTGGRVTTGGAIGSGGAVTTGGMVTTGGAVGTGGAVLTGDPCDGRVTDKNPRTMSAAQKPALGQIFEDPQFNNTRIRRISDAASRGSVKVIKPVYSTIQAWNADESYLVLYHTDGSPSGHYLYDGKTYAFIKELDIRPADLEQVYWSSTDPEIMYYTDITERRLYAFNVKTDTATLVKDFSKAPVSCNDDITGGTDPMWTSWDGANFGYTCGRGSGAKMFVYNRLTDTIGTIRSANSGGNAPQPAPSGRLFFLNVNDGAAQAVDANMQTLRTLDVESDAHATLGTADGVDTHFSVQFDAEPNGNLVAVDMTNGNKRVIIGPSTGWLDYPARGTHLSAVAFKNPGWLALDIVGEADGRTLLDNEVVLVNANSGGKICRLAHHRSCGSSDNCGTQGYWAEPHVTISPSGSRVLFASDWGGQPIVDTYVIELPNYTP